MGHVRQKQLARRKSEPATPITKSRSVIASLWIAPPLDCFVARAPRNDGWGADRFGGCCAPPNLAKHGLDFAALTQAFFEEAVIYPGKQGRLRAVGNLKQGTPWTVVFALLGNEAVSVVSMRHASKMEREDARTKTS